MNIIINITFFSLTLLFLPNLCIGQNSAVLKTLSNNNLRALDELELDTSDEVIRLYVELNDSMDLKFDRFPNLLELNVSSSFNNYTTYSQLKGLDDLRVLSFRPTLGLCINEDDADPCIMARDRIFPNEFHFPKKLLILDAASPFIQSIPDRVISECSDLRILLLHGMRYSDLPVSLIELNGLNYVIVEETTILPAEILFFKRFAPHLNLMYGSPEWLNGGEIDYTNKTVRAALLKNVKQRKPPKDGNFTLYFKKGGVALKGSFLNGHPSGNWELYNTSGVVIRKRSYSDNGLRAGTWQWFNDTGELMHEESYDNEGNRKSVCEYSKQSEVYLYQKQVFNGTNFVEVKTFFPNGTLESEYGLYDSHYHGPKKVYYPNGFLKEEVYYSYDINTYSPATKRYDYNGQLLHKIERIPLEGGIADSLSTFLQEHQIELPQDPSTLRKSTKYEPQNQKTIVSFTYLLSNNNQLVISTLYNYGSDTPLKTEVFFNNEIRKSILY